LIDTDAFEEALGVIPPEDWCRTWAARRTIMLGEKPQRESKR
jgi:hypothetical protein